MHSTLRYGARCWCRASDWARAEGGRRGGPGWGSGWGSGWGRRAEFAVRAFRSASCPRSRAPLVSTRNTALCTVCIWLFMLSSSLVRLVEPLSRNDLQCAQHGDVQGQHLGFYMGRQIDTMNISGPFCNVVGPLWRSATGSPGSKVPWRFNVSSLFRSSFRPTTTPFIPGGARQPCPS